MADRRPPPPEHTDNGHHRNHNQRARQHVATTYVTKVAPEIAENRSTKNPAFRNTLIRAPNVARFASVAVGKAWTAGPVPSP